MSLTYSEMHFPFFSPFFKQSHIFVLFLFCIDANIIEPFRHRVPKTYSPHSLIGDGPVKRCTQDGLPPCPRCLGKHHCGYKEGSWNFEGDAWVPVDVGQPKASALDVAMMSESSQSASGGPRLSCSKEKIPAATCGELGPQVRTAN